MADLAGATANDNDLIGDPDATHWAQRFAHKYLTEEDFGHNWDGDPEALLLPWFAGAIETGRGEGLKTVIGRPGDKVAFAPAGGADLDHIREMAEHIREVAGGVSVIICDGDVTRLDSSHGEHANLHPTLAWLLRQASDEWGALGVALSAAQMTDTWTLCSLLLGVETADLKGLNGGQLPDPWAPRQDGPACELDGRP